MKWKMPPVVKIYEALGAIGDGRISVDSDKGKVMSSKGNKKYSVKFDADTNAIMANDNGSFWQGYVGYPAISFLMKIGKIEFDDAVANSLKGIAWNDVNKKFQRDYEKTIEYCLQVAEKNGVNAKKVKIEVDRIYKILGKMELGMLGKKIYPPKDNG